MSYSSNTRKKQLKRTNSCKPLRYVFPITTSIYERGADHTYVNINGKYKAVPYTEGIDY